MAAIDWACFDSCEAAVTIGRLRPAICSKSWRSALKARKAMPLNRQGKAGQQDQTDRQARRDLNVQDCHPNSSAGPAQQDDTALFKVLSYNHNRRL
ncbi:MAG: hypothetical protein WDN69_17500 [Aliidongia sp.]